ncbi:uncharacterized protein LOC101855353 [Aplysia californica]|uniref:Uncharacterized protein LOC101855353 n=1 Tax=Aplysia californica TaxID=6500 RepID=A0ABM1A4A9_APLCA|nr:uncharacterized protein LOC101855353 [Aplysia californica]
MATSPFACIFHFSCLIFGGVGMQVALALAIVDRYVAIVYPLRYATIVTYNVVCACVIGIHSFIGAFSFAPLLPGFNNWWKTCTCTFNLVLSTGYLYTLVSLIMISMVVSMTLYSKVLHVARRHQHRIHAVVSQQPTSEGRAVGVSSRGTPHTGVRTLQENLQFEGRERNISGRTKNNVPQTTENNVQFGEGKKQFNSFPNARLGSEQLVLASEPQFELKKDGSLSHTHQESGEVSERRYSHDSTHGEDNRVVCQSPRQLTLACSGWSVISRGDPDRAGDEVSNRSVSGSCTSPPGFHCPRAGQIVVKCDQLYTNDNICLGTPRRGMSLLTREQSGDKSDLVRTDPAREAESSHPGSALQTLTSRVGNDGQGFPDAGQNQGPLLECRIKFTQSSMDKYSSKQSRNSSQDQHKSRSPHLPNYESAYEDHMEVSEKSQGDTTYVSSEQTHCVPIPFIQADSQHTKVEHPGNAESKQVRNVPLALQFHQKVMGVSSVLRQTTGSGHSFAPYDTSSPVSAQTSTNQAQDRTNLAQETIE